jgi:hypothetical protein
LKSHIANLGGVMSSSRSMLKCTCPIVLHISSLVILMSKIPLNAIIRRILPKSIIKSQISSYWRTI